MSDQDDIKRYIDGFDPSRRNFMLGLAVSGVGLSTLMPIGESLAQATDAEVKQLIIHIQSGAGVEAICRAHADPPFNKVYPNTSVHYEVAGNGIVYPKMLTQRDNPSVAGGQFNDTYAQRGIADRMWAKFDPAFIPNAKNLIEGLETPGGYGYRSALTPFGIMYNPNRVEEPKSWLDLFNPKYKGRVSMWAAYFDAYLMAAVATGKPADVEEGIKAWEPHKANIGAWVTSPVVEVDLVSRGEVWLAPHWGAWAEQPRSQGKNVAFTVPKEGAVQWSSNLQVVTGFSPKVTEITQRYFNAWFGDEMQKVWMEKSFLTPAVKTVTIPDSLKSNPAILTPDQITKLIKPDYSVIGPKLTYYKDIIDRTLKV